MTNPPKRTGDPILDQLNYDVWYARGNVEWLEEKAAKARRRCQLREEERAKYVVHGITPKRKAIRTAQMRAAISVANQSGDEVLKTAPSWRLMPRAKA